MAGTVTGGGARPTTNISISYNTYRPSNTPSRTGGSSGGGNSISDSMDFTDFIVTPYDMQELEAKSAPTNQIYTPGKTTGAPLEERMQMLNDTISGWQEVRNQLQNEYDGKYGKGIEFTNEDAMYNLFSVLNVLDVQGLLGVGHLMFLYTMDGPYLDEEFAGRVTDLVTEKGLLDKLQAYLNGASWEASGLADIYGADGENNFLYRLSEQCYSLELDERYYVDDYNNMDPEFIKKGYAELFHINDLNQEYNPYQTFDEITNKIADARTLETDINTVNSQLYQLEQLQKLLPFTYVVDNSDFGNYMERDYASDTTIPDRLKENMSQEELAIYIYLLEHNGKEKANEYIDAMEDQINQRIGMREAIEYIESMSANGFDAGDLFKSAGVGFGDGTQNFFDGLKDFFMADGVMSAFEYEIMFKVSLLANGENEYNLNLTEAERQILAFNYQSWQSIGNMWIPSALSFIPVVGKPLSSSLLFMSSAGNSTEGAMQQGADAFHAYLYGCLSGLSEVAFERMLGGIPGLSDMGESFLMNCLSEGREEFLQEWIDAGLRYAILGEPINLDETLNNSLYAALQGMAVSGLMQGGQNIAFTIGNTVITLNSTECDALTQLIETLQTNPNADISDSKVLDAIMNLDNSNPVKQKLVETLFTEMMKNPSLLKNLDSTTLNELVTAIPNPSIASLPLDSRVEVFNKLSTENKKLVFDKSFTSAEKYDLAIGSDKWKIDVYEGLTPENAYKYVTINSKGKVDFDWPGKGGYIPGTIKSLETLNGDLVISRVGGKGGNCWGLHLDIDATDINTPAAEDAIAGVTMNDRAILNGESVMNGKCGSFKGVLHVDLYNETVRVLNGLEINTPDSTVKQNLMNLGYDEFVADTLINDFKETAMNHSEWVGTDKPNIKDALREQGESADVTGTYGTTEAWEDFPGGATQMTTKLSADAMIKAGIITDVVDKIPIRAK